MPEAASIFYFNAADAAAMGRAPWSNPLNARFLNGLVASAESIGFPAAFYAASDQLTFTDAELSEAGLPAEWALAGVEVFVSGRWSGASDGAREVEVFTLIDGEVRESLGAGVLPISATNGDFSLGGLGVLGGVSMFEIAAGRFGIGVVASSTTTSAGGNDIEIDSVQARFWLAPPSPPVVHIAEAVAALLADALEGVQVQMLHHAVVGYPGLEDDSPGVVYVSPVSQTLTPWTRAPSWRRVVGVEVAVVAPAPEPESPASILQIAESHRLLESVLAAVAAEKRLPGRPSAALVEILNDPLADRELYQTRGVFGALVTLNYEEAL